mmetsp:Transcript_37912/g.76037  ORF Transcript_37912/g.76037 Transcript_37912/m.76037 type:complete len:237 (-) Transcript_37912:1047-1757(-)
MTCSITRWRQARSTPLVDARPRGLYKHHPRQGALGRSCRKCSVYERLIGPLSSRPPRRFPIKLAPFARQPRHALLAQQWEHASFAAARGLVHSLATWESWVATPKRRAELRWQQVVTELDVRKLVVVGPAARRNPLGRASRLARGRRCLHLRSLVLLIILRGGWPAAVVGLILIVVARAAPLSAVPGRCPLLLLLLLLQLLLPLLSLCFLPLLLLLCLLYPGRRCLLNSWRRRRCA